jgi:hypothetical protein
VAPSRSSSSPAPGCRHRGPVSHHGGSPPRARREHAGKAQQRIPGWRHESRDARQKMHGRQHQVSRAVATGLAKAVRDAAIGQERDALQAEGRARAVAAQPFKAGAIPRAERDARMDVEACHLAGPRALAPGAEASLVVRLCGGTPSSSRRTKVPPKSDSCMHASSGRVRGPRWSVPRSAARPRASAAAATASCASRRARRQRRCRRARAQGPSGKRPRDRPVE